jgi:outer membrane protein assembly factor BamA
MLVLGGLLAAGSAAQAQDTTPGECVTPDSIAFRGQKNVTEDVLRAGVGIAPKSTVNSRTTTRAIRDLYATNQFEDVSTTCEVIAGKQVLVFNVRETSRRSAARAECRPAR